MHYICNKEKKTTTRRTLVKSQMHRVLDYRKNDQSLFQLFLSAEHPVAWPSLGLHRKVRIHFKQTAHYLLRLSRIVY